LVTRTLATLLNEQLVHWLSQRTSRISASFIRSTLHLFLTSLFVASAVHLVHKQLFPFELAVRTAVVGMAAEQPSREVVERDDLAVLKIDPAYFRSTEGFNGKSPLDREVLQKLLEAIAAAMPELQSVGIDLDLSPALMGQPTCTEKKLYDWLGNWKNSRGQPVKVTLILPIEPSERAAAHDWLKDIRGKPNLSLANPDIVMPFGIASALQSWQDCPSLGVAVARSALDKSAGGPPYRCEAIPPISGACGQPDSSGNSPVCMQLSYHSFGVLSNLDHIYDEHGELLPLPRQIDALRNRPITTLLLGAAYSSDDLFMTAAGNMHGVDIHTAALLMTNDDGHGREHHYPWLDFAADIVIGMLFGALVHFLWHMYFSVRVGHSKRFLPGTAWVSLLILLAVLIQLWRYLLAGSVSALSQSDIWFNPTAMLVGMLIDAFVVGSVQVAQHELQHHVGHGHASASELQPPPDTSSPLRHRLHRLNFWTQWSLSQVPSLIWIGIVASAFKTLLSH